MKKHQKEFLPIYNPCPQIDLENWLEMVNNQERNQICLDIREQILSRVFQHTEKIDRDEECAKYIVGCAYEAWKKLFYIEFFNRDATCYDPLQDPCWTGDKIPDECVPDAWSANQIKMQKDRNIFYFGDNPPEASKLSLKSEESSMILQEDMECKFSEFSIVTKELIPEEMEEQCYYTYEEQFSDSLEEQKNSEEKEPYNVFSFTKLCPKDFLPYFPKEPEVPIHSLARKESICEGKPALAKCRTVVKDICPFKSKSCSKQRFVVLGEKSLQKDTSETIRKSLLPPIQKK